MLFKHKVCGFDSTTFSEGNDESQVPEDASCSM